MSGTSQAAPPLVSFAAILLSSVWSEGPARVKRRLIVSGDLLAKDNREVRSGSQLNIAKALIFDRDRITFEHGGVRRTFLGRLGAAATSRLRA